jgi:HK97 family phage major capsid protein
VPQRQPFGSRHGHIRTRKRTGGSWQGATTETTIGRIRTLNHKAEAQRLTAEARNLQQERRSILDDSRLSERDKRTKVADIEGRIETALSEARGHMHTAEALDLEERAVGLPGSENGGIAVRGGRAGEPEWRGILPSRAEIRTLMEADADPSGGGWVVPTQTRATLIDMLVSKAVFLAGLPRENVLTFSNDKFKVPRLGTSDEPVETAEGATISDGDLTLTGHDLDSKKFAILKHASNEILADSAVDLRRVLAADMVRQTAIKVDRECFNGSGGITGVISQGTAVPLGTGVDVDYDALADAVADIEATNADATVVYAAPDQAAVLRKLRADGATGEYLGGSPVSSPARTAWGLPVLVSTNVPAGHVLVVAGERIYFGVRQDVRLAASEHFKFDQDVISFRSTYRGAGVVVAESTSVQVLQADTA